VVFLCAYLAPEVLGSMRSFRRKIGFLLMALALGASLCASATPAQTHVSKHKKKGDAPPPPPYVPSPLQPLTLDQMPAVAPTVTYQGGVLTIVAPNSTLGDILRAVHKQTGAIVDVPANATERVAVRLGPAPAPDVLASLLNGSHFNYIVLGSATDRNLVSQVILTPKTGAVGGGAPAAVANNMPPSPGAYPPGAYPGGQPPQVQAQEQPEVSDGDNMDNSAGDTVDDASADQNDQQQDQNAQDAANPGAPGQVKTPEQLLQELQQQQQQQQLLLQQQQQQQNAGQPQTVYPTPSGIPVPPRPGPPQH
jgi:hypothetical protein